MARRALMFDPPWARARIVAQARRLAASAALPGAIKPILRPHEPAEV